MNNVNLTGRLTKDPETRTLPSSDTVVTELRLAVDRMGRNGEVGYVDVVSYGKAAEAAANVLSKGWLVAVDGRLEFSEWTDKDTDKTRTKLSVVGHIEFLAQPKQDGDAVPAAAGAGGASDDDIAF